MILLIKMVESSAHSEEAKIGKKHAALVKDKEEGVEEVEIMQNKHTKNVTSPFINQSKSWDDEELNIPADLKKGIIEQLGFLKPSKI